MKISKNKFKPLSHVVVRVPRYPLQTVLRSLGSEAELKRVFESNDFKNAILFASPALWVEMRKLVSGCVQRQRDRDKVKLSLLKYLSRMSSRCTPFATLAGCGCVAWGQQTAVSVTGSMEEFFRLDSMQCHNLSKRLHADRATREQLRFRISPSVYQAGKSHLRFITRISRGDGHVFQIREAKLSRPLRWIMGNALDFTPFTDLASSMAATLDLSATTATSYIHQLYDCGLLESEAEPYAIGGDYLQHLNRLLQSAGDIENQTTIAIKELEQKMKHFSSVHLVENNDSAHQHIISLLDQRGMRANPKFAIQVDGFARLEGSIDRSIISQINFGMDLLCRLTPAQQHTNMDRFVERFTARYQGQEIPLLEALDPDIGVGYVMTQGRISNPLVDAIRLPTRETTQIYSHTPVQQLLLQKLADHDWSQSHGIMLTDSDVAHLPADYGDLPDTMAAMFQIAEARPDGGHTLCDLRFIGSSAANLFGRFAYGSKQVSDLLSDVAKHEQKTHSDSVIAEIAHIPQSRTANILLRPHFRSHEIAYQSNTLVEESRRIAASDLLVSVLNGKVRLRSARLRRFVIPRLTTAHNYNGTDTSPVYRFLCDLQHQQGRTALMLSWGGLSGIRHLPRVAYRDIILLRERWLVDKSSLPFSKSHVDRAELKSWVRRLSLPQLVTMSVGDNKLLVDTDSTVSVQAMMTETAHASGIVLEEFIPTAHVVQDVYGTDYMNECIVPLIRFL